MSETQVSANSSSNQPPRGRLGALLLTLYLDLVGFSIVFPLYAGMMDWYASDGSGLIASWSSWLETTFQISDRDRVVTFFGASLGGLYAIGQFFVTPAWGRLSDRIGRRRVLLGTIALNLLGYLLWAFAGSFTLLLLSRLVGALASGNIGVASAAVADWSTPETRTKSMGLMGAVIGLGFITGPLLGSLYDFLPRIGAAEATGGFALHPFSVVAFVAMALTAFNLWWMWSQYADPPREEVEEPDGPMPGRSANPLRIFGRDLGPVVGRMSLAYLFFTIVFSGFESTFVFMGFQVLGWGPGQIGPLMGAIGFVSAGIQGGLIRRLSGRVSERTLAILGLFIFVPGLGLLALVPGNESETTFILGGLLLGAGVGFFAPTVAALASLAAPRGAQGVAMGRYRSAGALGRAIGPLFAGSLYFGFGASASYVVGMVVLAVPLALLWRPITMPTHPAGPTSSGPS